MGHRATVWTVTVVMALTALALAGIVSAVEYNPERHWDAGAPCYGWPAVDYDQDGVFDRLDRCNNTPLGCVVDAWGCHVDTDGDGVCDGVDKCPNTPGGMKVDKNGCAKSQLAISETTPPPPPKEVERPAPPPPPPPPPVSEVEKQLIEGGRIRLENVYFETGSANLLPESEATLDEVGRTLEKFGNLKMEVQGHTDTRGAASYNLRLSQARAESVRRYLLGHFNLTPENYVAKGYGETEPETQERNDEELLRNRRVVLNVLNPEALPRGVRVEQKP